MCVCVCVCVRVCVCACVCVCVCVGGYKRGSTTLILSVDNLFHLVKVHDNTTVICNLYCYFTSLTLCLLVIL